MYDAVVKCNGRCLNDSIISGLALQNSLPTVYIRFREGEFAWAADIQAMYSCIVLRAEDYTATIDSYGRKKMELLLSVYVTNTTLLLFNYAGGIKGNEDKMITRLCASDCFRTESSLSTIDANLNNVGAGVSDQELMLGITASEDEVTYANEKSG